MATRAVAKTGLRLCVSLLALVLWARGAAAADCASCHDQGQKLEKSAHSGLACETCHESHEQYPHPPGIAKPACTTCHSKQAGDYARSVHGQARRAGMRGRQIAHCVTEARTNCLPPSRRHSEPRFRTP